MATVGVKGLTKHGSVGGGKISSRSAA